MIKQFLHAVVWAKRYLTGQYHIGEISCVAKFIGSDEICLDIGSTRGLGLNRSRSWLRGDMYTLLRLCHTIQRSLGIPWHCSD